MVGQKFAAIPRETIVLYWHSSALELYKYLGYRRL